jgi:3-oxoacyl-[acyl-carrier-protein] synthase II
MDRRRVVVTAVAAITPIGNDAETSWNNLLAGVSGIGPLTRFDPAEYATRIAGEVKGFEPEAHIPPKQARRMERFTQFAVACQKMLLESARFAITPEEAERTGTIIGCGLGGLETIESQYQRLADAGPRRVSPFFIPIVIANMAPGMASIFSGARGPNLATTSACASGTHGVGYAFSEILLGRAEAMICGGVESCMTRTAVAGFNAMKALSTRNEEPEKASRPFDAARDGFVIGEGCGLLLIEELGHARARGAEILAEVVGFGASSDAFHMTAPPEDGAGMALCMRAALREAGVRPEEVDHVNAHGTSTYLNDLCETRALKTVFGEHAGKLAITANKSMIGHLLGAAGGVESVFSVLTLARGTIPGTINLENPDPECDLDYTSGGSVARQAEYALSNSFGFGGTNASILFKRFGD